MKILKRTLITVMIVIVVLVLSLYIYLRTTLPKTGGALTVSGIKNETSITYDRYGVPLITAETRDDMFFAVGFCHASDRLFQMDLARRMATGKLSEIFGKRALETDKYHKDLLIEESIETSLKEISPPLQTIIKNYCNGVNYFIDTQTLPPEFKLLGYQPEPWTAKDIFSIFKRMELILAGSGSELYHMKLVRALGEAKAKTLIAGTWGTTIINQDEYAAQFENDTLKTAYLNQLELTEHGVGSNNWVLSGQKTLSGAPILANDPHLSNIFPSYFYQIAAKTGGLELSGNTLPGVPFIIIGRNQHLGWGVTNVGTDVIDYFTLTVNPENKNQYEWDGQWIDFDFIEKAIKVKGAEDVIHKVKMSRLGPVYEENGLHLARHSVGQYPSKASEAFMEMNTAENVETFITALKKFSSPAQNVVFADTKGNIGYYPTGWIPKRKKGTGELPLPAVGSDEGWDGFMDENEKPYLLNPAKGYIVTANNPVLPDGSIPVFARNWFPSFRADRIDELIRATPKLSMEDNRRIQTDSLMPSARFLVNKIKGFSYESEQAAFTAEHLEKWDFHTDSGIAPYLFHRFRHHLTRHIFSDDIKDEKYQRLISVNWLYKIMNYPHPGAERTDFAAWTDDTNTPETEDFKTMVEKSLSAACNDYEEKSKKQNPDWRKIHTLKYRHLLGGLPVLKWFLNRGPYPVKGGRDCILTASYPRNSHFNVTHLSTFRMIMDFSDFSNSLLINSSGQSGHFMSAHYDDQIPLYTGLEYRKMEDADGKAKTLKLLPPAAKTLF